MDFEQEVQRLTFDRDMRNEVRHLIRMAVAAEREACAKIADDRERTDLAEQRAWEAGQIAKLIRARST